MQDTAYYREQAERARRLAKHADDDINATLLQMAQDFDDIAEGAIEIRHPELMPQNQR